MGADHEHADVKNTPISRLWIAFGLTGIFMIAEVIGSFVTGSLALLSDAMHMATDTFALLLALIAIYLGRRPADVLRTYGYARFEILAAAFNALLLLGVAFYILYEAWERLSEPADVQSLGMLAVAIVGLVMNFISMRILTVHKDDSLNVKGAYLEVWADMLGSVGVIAAAIIIYLTGWEWVDSAIAVGIGFMVFPRTWVLLKECINILLEGVPAGVDVKKLEAAILAVPGVASVHDLHVWSLTKTEHSLTAHLVLAQEADGETVRRAVEHVLQNDYDLHHTTLQTEKVTCAPKELIH
ncbi:cation diffusion facilitator family transporter [Brucella sp. 10RB9215]|uniref:cation diffusion facilitator family transporter n=1 Tax=Brucella sp. 10RB9215 TaxID=1149953 RepID=UPI000909D01C|nr:cation diffusion facilitator family transporter [Brucella sp. 10RB9215]SBW13382.1 cation diffusion facilitator family transporter [Brucella sp. 10RB9215]